MESHTYLHDLICNTLLYAVLGRYLVIRYHNPILIKGTVTSCSPYMIIIPLTCNSHS